ncbi:hypothetical protein ACP275_05G009200 [Erythranthe tilingii]
MCVHNKPVLLPDDIIETILPKLPVKSLLRFKAVSKSWKAMISDPAFVRKKHLHQSSQQDNHLFLWKSKQWSSGFSVVKFEDGKFQILHDLRECPYGWDTVVSFSDGVLLLTEYSDSTYVLWNPSTQAKTMIWFPYRFNSHPKSYGVCYDSISEDFKIVVISSMSMRDYAVYSCKNKIWTKKKKGFPGTGRLGNESGLCVNGSIYWVYREADARKIVYFDSGDDNFKILDKPKGVGENRPIFLACLKGCLSVYCNGENETVVRIWIREKNNCWVELVTIENVDTVIELFDVEFVAENKVVIRSNTTRLMIYNISEKKFEDYDDKAVFGYAMVPYLETLFFPIENTRPKRKRKCLS